jgi:hypothetical protein
MTEIEVIEFFKNREEESFNFTDIPESRRLSKRRDLNGFLLIDKLVPNSEEFIIAASEHDEIYISHSLEEIGKNATEEDLLDFMRCGFFLNDDYECLMKFV